MTHRSRFIPAVAAALVALSAPLLSQPLPEDDGVLYFPPKLTVHAAATDDLRPPRSSGEGNGGGSISMRFRADAEIEFLLPMIFFEGAGSLTIPDRYQIFFSSMEADNYFDSSDVVSQLNREENPKYRQLLNIIGYRMGAFPESRIELEGGYSTLPGETPEVGKARAEVVRDYLTTIWHVEPERIVLQQPRRVCDSSANILRQEEAQRVAIHSSDPNLLKPVRYNEVRTSETLLYFDLLIDPSMNSTDVTGIELVLSLGDRILSSTGIPAHPDSAIYRLHGLWPAFQLQGEEDNQLVVQAFIRTWQGTTRSTNAVRFTIDPARTEADEYDADYIRLDYFTLPFFEWRDSALTGLQSSFLDEYVQAFLTSTDERSAQPYIIYLSGTGDLSENREVDEATITTTAAFRSFETTIIRNLIAPENRFEVVFFEGEEEPNPYIFLNKWLGESYMNQIQEREKERDAHREEFYESRYQMLDSTLDGIIVGRGNLVARYLRERIGTDMLDSIDVDTEINSPYAYVLTPERRYYERSVTINLQQIYEYEEEDYYYDEEPAMDGGYEEEEYIEEEYREDEYEVESPAPAVPE